jgi:hypothetical protein
MDREENRHVGRERLQMCKDDVKSGTVDECGTVERHEEVLAAPESQCPAGLERSKAALERDE